MNIKVLYGKVLLWITRTISIDFAKKLDTFLRFRRHLDLKEPRTLADKVCYMELHENSPLVTMCTDKYAVRDYIISKGLEDILVPLVGGVWNNPDDIDFASLPESFVLKATHGCKMNFLVSNKLKMDIDACKREMARWMATSYGVYSLEPHYNSIQHRIYAEQYLGDMSSLIDYKIHCLNGKPEFILAVSERKVNGDAAMHVTIDMYNIDWEPMYEIVKSGHEVPGKGNIPRPAQLKEMLRIAEILSSDFKFVRVDLYNLKGRVFFGELTFTPACGVFAYCTETFLYDMGQKLNI